MFDGNIIEKMVELGIGLNVMRQIPGMMPSINLGQSLPQTPPPLQTGGYVDCYIAVDNQQVGPLSDSELVKLIQNGILNSDTLVWTPMLTQWTAAKFVPNVNKLLLLNSKSIVSHESPKECTQSNDIIRETVVAAIARLGFDNASVRKLVDEVLNSNPGITEADAIKKVLKSL